jgi:hypothetical protein
MAAPEILQQLLYKQPLDVIIEADFFDPLDQNHLFHYLGLGPLGASKVGPEKFEAPYQI